MTNNMDMVDLLCVCVFVRFKGQTATGVRQMALLHCTPKRGALWRADCYSLPKRQGLQIPNMLRRLESNSAEFRAPYGDKVLTSSPLIEVCFPCQEFRHLL